MLLCTCVSIGNLLPGEGVKGGMMTDEGEAANSSRLEDRGMT